MSPLNFHDSIVIIIIILIAIKAHSRGTITGNPSRTALRQQPAVPPAIVLSNADADPPFLVNRERDVIGPIDTLHMARNSIQDIDLALMPTELMSYRRGNINGIVYV